MPECPECKKEIHSVEVVYVVHEYWTKRKDGDEVMNARGDGDFVLYRCPRCLIPILVPNGWDGIGSAWNVYDEWTERVDKFLAEEA